MRALEMEVSYFTLRPSESLWMETYVVSCSQALMERVPLQQLWFYYLTPSLILSQNDWHQEWHLASNLQVT